MGAPNPAQELADESVGWRSYTLWPAGVELPHAHYWHNPATGETTWEMPEQVRLYRLCTWSTEYQCTRSELLHAPY